MARRSLKPQLNQIRAWVRQGRTDAWIAHQLEVTVAELREFRDQHELTPEEEDTGSKEMELRDEIEAEVEAATVEESEETEEAEEPEESEEPVEAEEDEKDEKDEKAEGPKEKKPGGDKAGEKGPQEETAKKGQQPGAGDGEGTRPRRRRRRGRRGGRGRRKDLEAAFDHGERDGYGLWLDPSVKNNPIYAEHWAGKREVSVRIEPDQIVIRRAGGDQNGDSAD